LGRVPNFSSCAFWDGNVLDTLLIEMYISITKKKKTFLFVYFDAFSMTNKYNPGV